MRIALVHSFYSSDSPSGENTTVLAQAAALTAAGHKVALFAKSTDIEQTSRLYTLRAAVNAAGLAGPSPVVELKEFNPDIVHIHNLFPNYGTEWIRDWQGPVVTTLHNYRTVCASGIMWRSGHDCSLCLDSTSMNAIVHRCYRASALASVPLAFSTRRGGRKSRLLNSSSVVVTLNYKSSEMFSRIVGPGVRVECVPNFAAKVEDYPVVARAWNRWVFVGRLTEEKGIAWLLLHWPASEQLLVVGSGPLEKMVRETADNSGGAIQFAGRLNSDDLSVELRKCAGIVIPSAWSEGIPTVALEALQAGASVVISSHCASAEELTSNNAGAIFEVEGTGGSLQQAIQSVQERRESADKFARDLYEGSFSERRWVDRMVGIYRGLI